MLDTKTGWDELWGTANRRICQIDLIKKYKDLMFHHGNKKLGPSFTISLPDLKLPPRFTQRKALLPPLGQVLRALRGCILDQSSFHLANIEMI